MALDFDVFVRQQIALEGVKNDLLAQFPNFSEEVVAVVIAALLASGYKTFADMPKGVLASTISKINKKLKATVVSFRAGTILVLRNIMSADIFVTTSVMSRLTRSRVTLAGASTNRRKLWASLTNNIIPGLGETMGEAIATYFRSVLSELTKSIKSSFADNVSVSEAIRRITGTKANLWKDGIVRKLFNNFGALTDTIIQTISNNVTAFFGKIFTDKYEWVSVIDSATTDVCRGRNGRIYRYGEGPMPPAHYRCRSRIRPVFSSANGPASFYEWLTGQPSKVQDFAVGSSAARDLRAGRRGAEDFRKFNSTRRLTPEEYRNSVDLLLTET